MFLTATLQIFPQYRTVQDSIYLRKRYRYRVQTIPKFKKINLNYRMRYVAILIHQLLFRAI